MVTPQELRRIKLKSDYSEMLNIKTGDVIQWKPVKGTPPYVEAYQLKVKVKTIIGEEPRYRDEHTIYLELPADYPVTSPQIKMETTTPFHPNWYKNGQWCGGRWHSSEGLGDYVIRMIRTLQFDLDITNPNSPANLDARDWFVRQQGRNLFPCDTTLLPDPTKSRFAIKPQIQRKFEIQ